MSNTETELSWGSDVLQLHTTIPGPDRKRTPTPYWYHLIYRSPNPEGPGCLLAWEVIGGRTPYQIAIEREETGTMQAHCTCADAIYRGEEAGHVCKHVRGLLQLGGELYHRITEPQSAPEPIPNAA